MSLSDAFRRQTVACENLGSPFMAQLLTLLADHWPEDTALARKCSSFRGDIGPAGASIPLRIAGGLHALRLQGDHVLAQVYPPQKPEIAKLQTAILQTLQTHDAFLTDWIDSPPQTNELRRSAVLIPAAHLLAKRFGLPIKLSELGASGGLNLMWDCFALQAGGTRYGPMDAVVSLHPEWSGPPPEPDHPIIAERRGVDLNPLDPTDPADLLRMTAYLWADQPERITNTKAAAGAVPAPVDQADAIDWLAARLAGPQGEWLHMIQNTIAWQYFPADAQARGRALIEEAGARATAPLAWVQLEADQGARGAGITMQLWPGGERHALGRADFHGRWVQWEKEVL